MQSGEKSSCVHEASHVLVYLYDDTHSLSAVAYCTETDTQTHWPLKRIARAICSSEREIKPLTFSEGIISAIRE